MFVSVVGIVIVPRHRQHLETARNEFVAFDLTRNLGFANRIAHAIVSMRIAKLVHGCAFYKIRFAIDANGKVATFFVFHSKLALSA